MIYRWRVYRYLTKDMHWRRAEAWRYAGKKARERKLHR